MTVLERLENQTGAARKCWRNESIITSLLWKREQFKIRLHSEGSVAEVVECLEYNIFRQSQPSCHEPFPGLL